MEIKGLVYGGKKYIKDPKRYRPKYLDTYEVKKGDTLKNISRKLYDDPRRSYEIATINGIKENTELKEGFILKIIKEGTYK